MGKVTINKEKLMGAIFKARILKGHKLEDVANELGIKLTTLRNHLYNEMPTSKLKMWCDYADIDVNDVLEVE